MSALTVILSFNIKSPLIQLTELKKKKRINANLGLRPNLEKLWHLFKTWGKKSFLLCLLKLCPMHFNNKCVGVK